MSFYAKCIECGQIVAVRNIQAYAEDTVECKDHYKEDKAQPRKESTTSSQTHNKAAHAILNSW